MRRGLAVLATALLVLLGITGETSSPVAAAQPEPEPPPPPKAWILVDHDTGAVIEAGNDRMALPPASVSKLLTAIIAERELSPESQVPVSALAEGMPARKINMKAGQTWTFKDAMYNLLIVSANDAAVALAERISGSREAFAQEMQRYATELQLGDGPVLYDPAGLDNEFSHKGGNVISARDMAIIARAALTDPDIRRIAATDTYRFHGGDGIDHRIVNHNQLLKTYPGAIGLKTGYTRRAGASLVSAATRDGRTMLAVVLGAPDPTRFSSELLDRGFAVPVPAEAGRPTLPPVALPPPHSQLEASVALAPPPPVPTPKPAPATSTWADRERLELALGFLTVLAVPGTLLVRRRRRRRRIFHPSRRARRRLTPLDDVWP